MRRLSFPYVISGAMLLLGVVLIQLGLYAGIQTLIGAGAVGMVYAIVQAGWCRVCTGRSGCLRGGPVDVRAPQPVKRSAAARCPRKPVDPTDAEALVEQMLDQGRFALLLRPQIAQNLSDNLFGRALVKLTETMALVPDGDVALEEAEAARLISVQRFFLDRYQVSNEAFYEFVAAGGYEQMALWDEAVLPALLDFVDSTGEPGPKFWIDGCYPDGRERHPVVGVSWYEAAAYARWIGKRLPGDAEWVKAGCWPVALGNRTRVQRKFPWGDVMDRGRANLWGTGPGDTVPVDDYAHGVSIGGVHQLVGNVWEWTTGNYRGASLPSEHLPLDGLTFSPPLKCVRGGAFDTYFDNQAACQFQSAENPLSRRHNIGFRCAVGVCDLMLVRAAESCSVDDAPAGDSRLLSVVS